MKNSIPRYTFYKNKYGSELLIDVVELKYVKRFLVESAVHTLTYYDITFVTEGEGSFSIDNRTYQAVPGDVFFSKPGEVRNWDTSILQDGKTASGLHLPDELYKRMLQLLHDIKVEIDQYRLLLFLILCDAFANVRVSPLWFTGVCINREKYYFSLCFCYVGFLLCPYLCLIQ